MAETDGERKRGATWLFKAGMLAVVVASLLLLSASALSVRLEYDEAFNLQIAESLRGGDGYSSFGALGSGEPWKFDPHVTTGPVVLLPVAAVWWLSDGSVAAARTLMLMFLFAYVIGWWVLLRRGRSGWLVAGLALMPALAATASSSGRVLGELPGAALLVWSGVALARQRPGLAALAIGLAIQTKVVYGLAGALVLAVWLIAALWAGERLRLRVLVVVALLAAAPSLAFEVYRFASVGSVEKYLESIGEFRQFLSGQKISNWLDPATLGAKMAGLLGSYPIYAWVALLAGAVVLICRAAFIEGSRRPVADGVDRVPPQVFTALAALFIAGIALLLGWITQSSQTGVRQAAPFFLLSVPALVALFLLPCVEFMRESETTRSHAGLQRVAGLAAAVLLSAAIVSALAESMHQVAFDEDARASAAEQRQVTETIRSLQPASIYGKGFWHNPEYQVLTGVRGVARRTYDRQLMIVQDYQIALSNTSWEEHEAKCGRVVQKSELTLLCWMPEAPTGQLFRVLDWGPQSSRAGTLPLPQPDGGSAIWFKIAPVIPEEIGGVRIHIGRQVVPANLTLPGADLLSGVVPDTLFQQPGSYDVVLEQVSTERRVHVGTMHIERTGFKVLDWGPKSSRVGKLPLPQPAGGSAIWFKIAPVKPEDFGAVRIHIGPHEVDADLSLPGGDLISGIVPGELYMQPGTHDVALEQVSTKDMTQVGKLRVK